MRLPRADDSETSTAKKPVKLDRIPKSMIRPARARLSAWRKLIAPPSSRTTRRPIAYFPGERPRVSVSHSNG